MKHRWSLLTIIIFLLVVGCNVKNNDTATQDGPIIQESNPNLLTSAEPNNSGQIGETKEQVSDISAIINKLLDVNHKYSALEGKIIKTLESTGEKELVELVIEQPSRFYVKHILDSKTPDRFEESINDGTNVQIKGSDGEISKLTPADINGLGVLLPIGGVNELLYPKMFIHNAISSGQSTLKVEEKFLDRDSTVIVINRKVGIEKLGNKLTIWFDNQAGIILKIVSSDGDKPVQTIAFDQIKFTEKANEEKFKNIK
ncbi:MULTISPECIES: hypothetical protein [unclassified Paenibacillus]|uniref:hypothetical protein n=1 Tax=unclassified Paenibacillus TaxID=185978 RepID=UPI002786F57A|nr:MULTISPECIES: hypothetical protein [unclassified Paenibacillus]MDQ0896420.1 outer membrane lipoprotein-sorting protein [Paenibacillus sp. V4I7]MDQ0914036.1 outer membrane lipoprotein-sorting protein [Paenibacillus sp. V4I5]